MFLAPGGVPGSLQCCVVNHECNSFGVVHFDVVLLIFDVVLLIISVSYHTHMYGEKAVYTLAISVPVTSGT